MKKGTVQSRLPLGIREGNSHNTITISSRYISGNKIGRLRPIYTNDTYSFFIKDILNSFFTDHLSKGPFAQPDIKTFFWWNKIWKSHYSCWVIFHRLRYIKSVSVNVTATAGCHTGQNSNQIEPKLTPNLE